MALEATQKSVFILASYAPSLVLFRLPLIEQLQAAGWRVVVGANRSEFRDSDVEALRGLGVDVFDVKIARNSVGITTNLRSLLSIRRALKAGKCDVLIPYTAIPVIFGAIAAKLAGYRHVVPLVTGLGSMFIGEPANLKQRAVRKIFFQLYKLAFSLSDLVCFQNQDDPRDLKRLGLLAETKELLIINGSGVDTDYFAYRAPTVEIGKTRFLMVARLLKDKGVREYAEAAKQLKKKCPGASFKLIGPLDSNPTSISEPELKSWTWIDHIEWLDDVRPELEACDVFVLPSYREGTPRSVLEAMSAGRAIVTTDAPGCRETVIDGQNGFLVPPRNVDSLVAAMGRFIQRPELISEMGKLSRKLAEKKYDERVVYRPLIARVGEL